VKLVHLDGFIIKKFVTMHGHMNVKFGVVYVYLMGTSNLINFLCLIMASFYILVFLYGMQQVVMFLTFI